MPKVAIILSTYNRPDMLRRMVESIAAQGHSDWHLYLCDDASTMPEQQRALEECAIAGKSTILRNKQNWGNVTRGRNTAILHALDNLPDCEYFVFSDDDNTWKPWRLGAQMDFMEMNHDCGMSWGNCEGFRDGRSIGKLRADEPQHYERQFLLSRPYIDSNEIMVRRSLWEQIGFFDERLKTLEDWDITLRAGLATKVLHFDMPLINYALHDDNRVTKTLHLNGESARIIGMRESLAGPRYRVLFVKPAPQKDVINHSHMQVMDSIERALSRMPFVTARNCVALEPVERIADEFRPNLIICFYPARIPASATHWFGAKPYPTLGLCVEDPYAHALNKGVRPLYEWFVTNDRGCVDAYKSADKPYSMLMPTLSADEYTHIPVYTEDKGADVVMVGAPYPKRVEAAQVLSKLSAEGKRIVVIGEGWQEFAPAGVEVIGRNVSGEEYAQWCASAKITALVNRDYPGGQKPVTPARGFVEAFSGGCLLMEHDREDTERYFTSSEVEFFDGIGELADKARALLSDNEKRARMRCAARLKGERFTYDARLRRLFMITRGYRANEEVL